MQKKRVAILISGRGSNMQSLIAAAEAPGFPAEIVLVFANKTDAAGLAFAAQHGIATKAVSHKGFASRDDFDAEIDKALEQAGAEIVCLAGFMRILSEGFTRKWQGRMINIHPSLLPSFKGAHAHDLAIEAGVRISGCTVHFAVAELDSGPIIAQAAVPVETGDTADTLAARILVAEHRIYPEALSLLAAGKVRLEGSKAVFG
ncbi:MAG: phosphoribosylglycinamide formyltransferase [Rhizomicrobium sp.]